MRRRERLRLGHPRDSIVDCRAPRRCLQVHALFPGGIRTLVSRSATVLTENVVRVLSTRPMKTRTGLPITDDDRRRLVTARRSIVPRCGSLWVDGLQIYEMKGLSAGLI